MKKIFLSVLFLLSCVIICFGGSTICVDVEVSTTSYRPVMGIIDRVYSDGTRMTMFFKSGNYIIGALVSKYDMISTELAIPDKAVMKEYYIKSDMSKIIKASDVYKAQAEP